MPDTPPFPRLRSLEASRRGFVAGALAGLSPAAIATAQVVGEASLRQLRTAPLSAGPQFIQDAVWQFVSGDLSARADGIDVIPSDHVPLSQGAWVRQTDASLISRRSDAGAVDAPLSFLIDALPRRPEEFGAIGDGVHDDAPAIQRALDAISSSSAARGANTYPGALMLTQGKRYRCGSRIVIDRRFHNILGYATLDFSGWSGIYLQIMGSQTEFGNSNGQNGCIDGQIVIVGAGAGADPRNPSVGILFDSPLRASATSIRSVGVTVTRCDVAFQIGARGYNQDFINCKAFDCDVIFDWLRDVEDNDERTSIFGGTFYNSRLFLRHRRDAGAFYIYGCSIDYTQQIAEIISGKVQMFGVHLESNRWIDRPIRVAGNGGLFSMHGGWLLLMENKGGLTHYFDVEEGCRVKLSDVITNNTHEARTPDIRTPTTWATGTGRFEMHGTEPAFEHGGFPARLHDRYSVLADPGFDEPDIQINPIWRTADVNPIRSRDGRDAPRSGEPANNISFGRVTRDQMEGSGCLRINKAHGGGSAAAMTIVAIPVRYGDRAKGGFRIRTAPDRPGASRKLMVRGGFAIIDGADHHGVPIIRRFVAPGNLELTPPTETYVLAVPGNGASDFVAPSWATHYLIQIDLQLADQASFLVDGRWADRW